MLPSAIGGPDGCLGGHGFAIFGLCRGKPSSTTFGSPGGPDRRSEMALDLLEAAKVQQAVVVVQDIPDRPSAGARRLGWLRERPPSSLCLPAQRFKQPARYLAMRPHSRATGAGGRVVREVRCVFHDLAQSFLPNRTFAYACSKSDRSCEHHLEITPLLTVG
jgi:hypothetical protein